MDNSAAMDTASVRIDTPALEPFVIDEQRIRVGDLVLNRTDRVLSSTHDSSTVLTNNEFIMLQTLLENAGRFVSKDVLLFAVAGAEIDPHHSIVDTYISFLQRAFQKAGTAATIERSPELGFRLLP